jgi:hypothetical protein
MRRAHYNECDNVALDMSARASLPRASVALALLATLAAGACSSRGSVTFQINPPVVPVFNPLSSKRLSEYELQSTDGTLVGVASVSANDDRALLPLGSLKVTPKPEDVVMSLFSGSQLLGMARIRDVEIKKEQQKTFDAFVRKPLVFVGSALPAESAMFNAVTDGQILDFTSTTTDLAHPATRDTNTPKLPDNISAAAVTSDGTMLLAGRKSLLTVYDTGTGITQDLVLPFTPARVVVAPRDAAAATLDPGDATNGGAVALFRDVAALRQSASTTMPVTVKLPGVQPRAAVFSDDAAMLYVLGGGGADPCGPGVPPPGNTITQVGVADGTVQGTWSMPDFVSDLASDTVGVLVSRSVAGQVARITPGPNPSAAPTFQKVFDATCPTALHVTNGEVLAVTSQHDSMLNTFAIVRDHLDNSPATTLPIGAPVFQTDDTGVMAPSPSPNQPAESITLTPVSLYAYDLAVTPDGGTAVFAARLRYTESNTPFQVLGAIDCTATLDIVEYGLYIVDTASGNATYQQRSQIVTNPESTNDPCMVCPLDALDELPFYCDSSPGDKAAGLAAIFGGP